MLGRWRASLSVRFEPCNRRSRVMSVKAFFRWLFESGFLEANPAAGLRADPVPRKPIKYLTTEQRHELLGHFEQHVDMPWGLFGLLVGQTGARCGEIRTLRWRDIDGVVVRIWGSKTQQGRSVPIPRPLAGMLQDLRGAPDDHVFAGPPNEDRVCRWLGPARRNGPKFYWSWKILRASYATHLISMGVPVEVVSRLLGHSRVDLTLTHYGFLRPDSYFGRIAELLGDGSEG
ncbi:MAG: tyrosine-type recombinase/integrase [Planctomycetes bacterium]|nr:tyrosine-type recombinase/integrase [Planctomycetota bacterium]